MFKQHSSSILPEPSFQQHRSNGIVPASLKHRSSIAPSIILAPASFQHYSSIVRASFQPASFHIVPALFEHFSSIVPLSVQHCLHLALWPSATRQQHLVVSSVGSGHSISTSSNVVMPAVPALWQHEALPASTCHYSHPAWILHTQTGAHGSHCLAQEPGSHPQQVRQRAPEDRATTCLIHWHGRTRSIQASGYRRQLPLPRRRAVMPRVP